MILAFLLFIGITYLGVKNYSNAKKFTNAESPEVKRRKRSAIFFAVIGGFGVLVCLSDFKTSMMQYTHTSKDSDYEIPKSNSKPIIAPKKDYRKPKESNYASDGLKCTQCFGHYQNGYCSQCGAASADRVYETYSKASNCAYCQGSGVIPNGNRYKVCPSCRGTGKQIY